MSLDENQMESGDQERNERNNPHGFVLPVDDISFEELKEAACQKLKMILAERL